MSSDPVFGTTQIIALVEQQDIEEHLKEPTKKLLETLLRRYQNGITEDEIERLTNILESQAQVFRIKNDVSNAFACEAAVGVLEEALGALISEHGQATNDVSNARPSPDSSKRRITPYRKDSPTAPPFDAVSIPNFIVDWGSAGGFLPSLQKFISKNIKSEPGVWENLTIEGVPPLADGTVLKVGRFITPPSTTATLYIEHASCAQHLIPAIKQWKHELKIHAQAQRASQSPELKQGGYISLPQLFDSKRLATIRTALMEEIATLPEGTLEANSGVITICPYGHEIQLRVTFSTDGKCIVYFHEDSQLAIEDFANRVAPPNRSSKGEHQAEALRRTDSLNLRSWQNKKALESLPDIRENPNSHIPVPQPSAPEPENYISPTARYAVLEIINLGIESQQSIRQPQEREILHHLCKSAFAEFESAPLGMTLSQIQQVRQKAFAQASSYLNSSNGLAAHRAVTNTIDAAIRKLSDISPVSASSSLDARYASGQSTTSPLHAEVDLPQVSEPIREVQPLESIHEAGPESDAHQEPIDEAPLDISKPEISTGESANITDALAIGALATAAMQKETAPTLLAEPSQEPALAMHQPVVATEEEPSPPPQESMNELATDEIEAGEAHESTFTQAETSGHAGDESPVITKVKPGKARGHLPSRSSLAPSHPTSRTPWRPGFIDEAGAEAPIPLAARSILAKAAHKTGTPEIDPTARYEVSAVIGLGLNPLRGRVAASVLDRLQHECNIAFSPFKDHGGITLAEIEGIRHAAIAKSTSPNESRDILEAQRAVANILQTAIAQLESIRPIPNPTTARIRQFSDKFQPGRTPEEKAKPVPRAQRKPEAKPRPKPEPKQRVEKKAQPAITEPNHKIFDRRWQALEEFEQTNNMEAGDISAFIASGPNEAISLDAKKFAEKLDRAKRTLGWNKVDDIETAEKILDRLAAAYTNHHAKRQSSGISKAGD